MRRWMKGTPVRVPDPPVPEPVHPRDNTPEILELFEKDGVVRIESPDGAGSYTFVKDKTNIKNYPMTMYWDGRSHGTTVHQAYPGHPRDPVFGGEVAYWFRDLRPFYSDQKALVAVILQFIKAGKLIYSNDCGQTMSVSSGS